MITVKAGERPRVLSFPIYQPPAPAPLTPDELHQAALDELDSAITDLDAALIRTNAARAALDDAERVLLIASHRVAIARAAVAGQLPLSLEPAP